ncbi:MAG: hypothetical protein ACREQT_13810 [Candidatus Binataceae bacterium]
MAFGGSNLDAFVPLAEALRELEVTIGPAARPVIAEVRVRLAEAAALRANGDLPAAIETIRLAMERLSALASGLDPAEGAVMRLIAERFTAALNLGDKGVAKETVNFMRHRAGDPKDDPDSDW